MKTGRYRLLREQVVPRRLDEVFAFFSQAENLEAITPEWLRFKVLRVHPKPVQQGTLIDYKLRLRGISLRWTSRIVEWEPPHKFVDLQVRGPYKLWHHTHRFAAEGESTRIADEVLYELPLGVLGRLAHWVMARRDVEKIFDYRAAKIRSLFI